MFTTLSKKEVADFCKKMSSGVKIRKRNLFYVQPHSYTHIEVLHRQWIGNDKSCAMFYANGTVSYSQALIGAKTFCKQLNALYPTKVNF